MNIDNIISYIEYLKKECFLSVSVHFSKEAFASLPDELCMALLPYNSHENPYCTAIKKTSYEKCIHSQHRLYDTCVPYTSVCRTCFAGVSEYIYPICHDNTVKGFIAISGYCGENSRDDLALHLKKETIPMALCDTLIPPLSLMLERLFLEHSGNTSDEYTQILRFVNEYHTNITVSQIADYFDRSVSHISHTFKKKSGMSVSEYCNNLRLLDAEKLLTGTSLSVTRIALDVGFSDTSYFIRLFKKRHSLSPLQYRKKLKKEK